VESFNLNGSLILVENIDMFKVNDRWWMQTYVRLN